MADEEFHHSQHTGETHHHHRHHQHRHIDANSMSEIARRRKKRMKVLTKLLFITLCALAIIILCFAAWLYAGGE